MKTKEILENEFIGKSGGEDAITNIARQLASSAATQFRGPKAKEAAEAGANRIYSQMLKTIDDYFNQPPIKDIN